MTCLRSAPSSAVSLDQGKQTTFMLNVPPNPSCVGLSLKSLFKKLLCSSSCDNGLTGLFGWRCFISYDRQAFKKLLFCTPGSYSISYLNFVRPTKLITLILSITVQPRYATELNCKKLLQPRTNNFIVKQGEECTKLGQRRNQNTLNLQSTLQIYCIKTILFSDLSQIDVYACHDSV